MNDGSEFLDEVCGVISSALDQPPSAVTPEVSVIHDLGASSLDLLDVVFALEQKYDIEITRGALEAAARGDMTEDEFAPDGEISEAGLARLRELLPESVTRIKPGLHPREIPGLFTVRTFARIVEALRARRAP